MKGVIIMQIYRVCVLTQTQEDCEAYLNLNLPGGRYGLTGFWTHSIKCAKALLEDRNDMAVLIGNGLSWSKIVCTTLDNVVIDNSLIKEKKTGHDDRYDKEEVFVVKIKDENKVKILE